MGNSNVRASTLALAVKRLKRPKSKGMESSRGPWSWAIQGQGRKRFKRGAGGLEDQ